MALAMQAAVARIAAEEGRDLAIRIGIDTGPVVAGVIGTKKFSFDLWGDAVNTSSRMESHGIPGQIQVTEAVFRRLRDRYAFEPRGRIEVKGIGEMAVHLLKGRASGAIATTGGPEVGEPAPAAVSVSAPR